MASVKRYAIERRGHAIQVEFDTSMVFANRLRLFVDGRRADERSVWWGVTRLHADPPDDGPRSGWRSAAAGGVR
jgi:hypothetical protein